MSYNLTALNEQLTEQLSKLTGLSKTQIINYAVEKVSLTMIDNFKDMIPAQIENIITAEIKEILRRHKPGRREIRPPGDQAARRPGRPEIRPPGDQAARRSGRPETRPPGDQAA